ncbi:hypothetical protein HWC35_gp105 [Vibrio phage USC-1]|uniref:Uncharacterized protein n=2 Tax=Aphroditevirus USC1 TaxID=2846605 RepID=A0A514A2L2_9CAUD|nr:hypothetical protein HWC35_gp105 [Vibrio phage USC-1]QCW23229.1 hypothetical protein [Vibrio phage 5 TSL-2019]QDH47499.1 hypothetical protein [Vibrio phage USC-1]
MQFNLVGTPSLASKINGTLLVQTQTLFFNLLLEELIAARRVSMGVQPELKEDEDHDPDVDSENRILDMCEAIIGEAPEDRPEEEHKSMLEALEQDISNLLHEATEVFSNNSDNNDQLDVLSNQNLNDVKELNWVLSENGNLALRLK